jgi:hypothetical protein
VTCRHISEACNVNSIACFVCFVKIKVFKEKFNFFYYAVIMMFIAVQYYVRMSCSMHCK